MVNYIGTVACTKRGKLQKRVIMIFTYGLSLQNIAIVISAQIMFVMDTIDISSRLDRSHMALLRARHEAEHDAMTGLWNKVAGTTKIREYMAQM